MRWGWGKGDEGFVGESDYVGMNAASAQAASVRMPDESNEKHQQFASKKARNRQMEWNQDAGMKSRNMKALQRAE